MIVAILSITLLGIVLGFGLGFAAQKFTVETDAQVAEIETMMPGSNCGQCGFPGCAGAAAAIAAGEATVTVCPPGGKALATALATKLGITVDLSSMADEGPKIATIAEEICIGCCRCIKECPTDVIVGAAKQIHAVMREACTGCGNCIDRCPTEAVKMEPVPVTLQHWVWPKPVQEDAWA
ncbi:MAG: RnfABCDGE type electron transport complex subunit B [Rhodocyclaceae bacterium]|nr:RnfABCDGE type electron transport complex subunit B [Rhodocyclaceae bacterium]